MKIYYYEIFETISIFFNCRMALLKAVEADPLTADENLLIEDDEDEDSEEKMAAKESNCHMRETIIALHRYRIENLLLTATISLERF